jgi:hypothetical protein
VFQLYWAIIRLCILNLTVILVLWGLFFRISRGCCEIQEAYGSFLHSHNFFTHSHTFPSLAHFFPPLAHFFSPLTHFFLIHTFPPLARFCPNSYNFFSTHTLPPPHSNTSSPLTHFFPSTHKLFPSTTTFFPPHPPPPPPPITHFLAQFFLLPRAWSQLKYRCLEHIEPAFTSQDTYLVRYLSTAFRFNLPEQPLPVFRAENKLDLIAVLRRIGKWRFTHSWRRH